MHRVTVSKVIDAPATKVWDLLADFENTYVYHPIVAHSKSLNGKSTGLGAQRQCDMYSGASVQEEITSFDRVNSTYEVTVTDHGPFPLTSMVVDIRVTPAPGNKAKVTYDGAFQPKFGPVGWLMAKLMMKRQFGTMFASLIDGVDTHLRTGRRIGKGGAVETVDDLRRVA